MPKLSSSSAVLEPETQPIGDHILSSPSPSTIPHPFIPGLHIDPAILRHPSLNAADPFTPAFLAPQTCVTLASVVPWTMISKRYPHRGMPFYTIPAAGHDPDTDLDHPVQLLSCMNTSTLIIDSFATYSQGNSASGLQYTQRPVYAIGSYLDPGNTNHGYAVDLIQEFAGDHPNLSADGRLGLGIIIGLAPWQQHNQPHPLEVSRLQTLQKNFFLARIRQADDAYVSGNIKSKERYCNQEARRALEFAHSLYAEPLEKHPWYIALGPISNLVQCPCCGNPFNSQYFICTTCQSNLADYYFTRSHLAFDPAKFPGIAQEIAFMQTQVAKKS